MQNMILIIDDDRELCELLRDYLTEEGFSLDSVYDGELGVEKALRNSYDLVVLDVMLPRLSGFEVLRRIRSASQVPVLMLTARGDEIDRIVGLEMGADDYLPKPFNPRELVARIRAVQRRMTTSSNFREVSPEILTVGDVTIDLGTRTVLCGGEQVMLTSVEFSVLEVLLRAAARVISREDLCLQALGRRPNYNDRSIDVHVSSLRKKLGLSSDRMERIKSVRGVGYIYTCPAVERR